MPKITFFLVSAMVFICASIVLCRITYSQNLILNGGKQPASQPNGQVSPPAKSRDTKQSSDLLDRRPLDGSIVGRKYTNKFFDFSIEFPENWIVILVNQGPKEGPKGVSYALLAVGSRDKQMDGNRWIVIAATRPRGSTLTAPSARSLVEKEAYDIDLITSMGLGKGFQPMGKPSEVSLGGRRMTRVHFAAEVNVGGNNYQTRWSQLAVVERGCLLMFISSDPLNRESDAGSAVRALDSLRFFSEGHASRQ
jgi:hypothetical protein